MIGLCIEYEWKERSSKPADLILVIIQMAHSENSFICSSSKFCKF